MAIDFPNSPAPGANHTVDGKTWTFTDGKWALNVSVEGVRGPAGIAFQGTAPTTTDVLWADTSVSGVAVVPAGGTTGQMLAKSSGADYDTAWATPVTSSDLALKANLASPTLTGTPLAPTAAAATNTTQIATTAFVRGEVTALVNSATATLDTLGEIATALGNDANLSTTLTTAIGLKAPLASPTFTGTVTIPSGASISGFAPLASPVFTGTVSGVTATMVGLGSVDNTADTSKPVSTAQQTALNLKANLASPSFTGTISTTDTISSTGRGEFTTVFSAGRGVGIKAPVGDATAGILQFTNNAQSVQWATLSATNGTINLTSYASAGDTVLNLNATYTRTSANLAVGNSATGYRLEVDGRARIRGNAGGTAGIWYTNNAGNEYVFSGLINDTTFGVYSVGDWRVSISDVLTTIGTASITLGGVGTNAVSIPYCAMLINRLWDTYPGIQVNNDTTWGGVGEFRIHGYSGPSGGDFGVNLRIDGTYLTVSDGRMKKDVSNIDGALETVKNLRGVKYRRMNRQLDTDISETSITDGVKYGFIAQEIMEHAPEVVFQTPNHEALENGWADEFAVDYGGITPLLVEAIKELEARLSAVEGAQ